MICLPSGARVYDLRGDRDPTAGKVTMRRGAPVERVATGVMLHQTAVEYGVSAAQLRAAGGDRALALARRALGIGAHVTLFRSREDHPPLVVLGAPLAWLVWHGNRANDATIGLEVEGRYEGVEGRAGTLWSPPGSRVTPTAPTPQDVAGWRDGLRYVVELARAEGHPTEWLVSHRQSSATRRSDPGSWLWQTLALWAEGEGLLELDRGRTWADGRTIPVEWDPRGVGRY